MLEAFAENDGFKDNEILEYYGDQIVNATMSECEFDAYSIIPKSYNDEFFDSDKNEDALSKIRAAHVNKSALAHCIEFLGLDEYLLLGKSDEKNEVWRNEKVRCDLFEAIIGAVAVASAKEAYINGKCIRKWDYETIGKSCWKMWEILNFEENYYDKLVDLCDDLEINSPEISVSRNYGGENSYKAICRLNLQKNGCTTSIDENGTSESSAMMNVAKKAISFLHLFQVKQILKNANPKTAVQTLNDLYLKKLISSPYFSPAEQKKCPIAPVISGNR